MNVLHSLLKQQSTRSKLRLKKKAVKEAWNAGKQPHESLKESLSKVYVAWVTYDCMRDVCKMQGVRFGTVWMQNKIDLILIDDESKEFCVLQTFDVKSGALTIYPELTEMHQRFGKLLEIHKVVVAIRRTSRGIVVQCGSLEVVTPHAMNIMTPVKGKKLFLDKSVFD